MASLERFSKRFGFLTRRVEKNIPRLQRKVAIAVDQTVVIATPVDEGRARSNWLVNAGPARDDTIPPYSPGKEGSTAGPNTQLALNQGRAAVVSHRPGQDIHVTNNLPYIGALNNGSSAQAPANFVRKAVNAAVASVKGAKITTGRGL